MRKILFICLITLLLLMFFAVTDLALAHRHHSYSHHSYSRYSFGFWFGPPTSYWAPYPWDAYPYYPPYYYNRPPYREYRVWVPDHWEWRQTPYGWQQVWIPGYWGYAP